MAGVFAGGNNFHYGLLLAPVFVVFFFQLGRGLGNTGYVLYLIAALVVLTRRRNFDFPVAASVLFAVLLAWGTLSAALSLDPRSAYWAWAKYALLGSAYFITWRLVRQIPQFSMARALKMIGAVGLLSFALFAARFLVLWGAPDFRPESQIQGLVPAYLSPFTLYFLLQAFPGKRGVYLGLAYLVGLAVLLVFSNSLTEVLALAAALVVLAFFVIPNRRWLMLSLGGVAVFFIALILLFDPAGTVLGHAQDQAGGWFPLLDELSGYRMRIWRQALAMPPPDPWLGVGPGNVGLYPPVVVTETHIVRHLHNLLLDCWYEIGLLGLIAYLSFHGAQIRAMRLGTKNMDTFHRGVMYAAVAGIFVASMLDQPYRSHHVALLVPFLFALYSRGSTQRGQGLSR
ncbi:MAG: O-antigen ligase family protein [Pseudomonadota bacterium]|nr:O-antigen ligase family protein [Pseudomonadota bacterium]